MKYKCLIIDDEQLARELIEMYCKKTPQLELVGLCKNTQEAIEIMNSTEIDILFLDIQLPDINGIEFAKTLIDSPYIIFTTAYNNFAIDGFELNAVDYLLKPFAYTRFLKAIQKISLRSEKKLLPNYIHIKADHKIHRLQFDDIQYIEGLREYVTFYTNGKQIITLESLKRLENTLPSSFIRVHKSYIVNNKFINSVCGSQLEVGKAKIPVGKSYKKEVSELFEIK